MNKTDESLFFTNTKELKVYKRLAKVTTMLPPPFKYTNRQMHTNDVVDVSKMIEDRIIKQFEKNKVYNLHESCLVHDFGHCCFAHEAEKQINSFIANKLRVKEDEVGFSHAVNGALVLALAVNPKVKRSSLAKMNLYKSHPKDIEMIVDSMIKHSFKANYIGSVYLNYINEEYKTITGRSLIKKPIKDPLFNTGYYVKVADDIASKNSDPIDLINHYYFNRIVISKSSSPEYFVLANKYINALEKAIIPISNSFKIDTVYESLDLYKTEDDLLHITYGFDYKKGITTKAEIVLREILELISENPRLLKKDYSQKFAYIRRIFVKDVAKIGMSKRLNAHNLSLVKNRFYKNPNDKTSQYYRIYHRYICTIAYQISNFTDIDLINFALSICGGLTEKAYQSSIQLKELYV